jgi:hypothetical protein
LLQCKLVDFYNGVRPVLLAKIVTSWVAVAVHCVQFIRLV